jgi:hypothetical protein
LRTYFSTLISSIQEEAISIQAEIEQTLELEQARIGKEREREKEKELISILRSFVFR